MILKSSPPPSPLPAPFPSCHLLFETRFCYAAWAGLKLVLSHLAFSSVVTHRWTAHCPAKFCFWRNIITHLNTSEEESLIIKFTILQLFEIKNKSIFTGQPRGQMENTQSAVWMATPSRGKGTSLPPSFFKQLISASPPSQARGRCSLTLQVLVYLSSCSWKMQAPRVEV